MSSHHSLKSIMNQPKVAQTSPIPVTVEAGKTYYWCSCGESKAQPFCDGSHKGTGFTPVAYTAEKDGPVYFCACKQSNKGVLCDGSHKGLDAV
jgi:CDGSH-type Zn-finger protein